MIYGASLSRPAASSIHVLDTSPVEAGFLDWAFLFEPAFSRAKRSGAQGADADPSRFWGPYDLTLLEHADMPLVPLERDCLI
jgi:hypothetical protein